MAYTTINKPSEYFNTVLYTGNGSTQSITGVGHQPDLVWIKHRNNATLWNHSLHDSVRGSTKYITSNGTDQEITDANSVTSFNSDGFSIGTFVKINDNGVNHVAWNWKANGAGSSNTDGSITSTVNVNTTSGFSIVKWTGTGSDGTIGHGLGVAPKMVIVKSLANTTAWMVYHASLGNAQEIYLNSTSASGASTAWNSTTPTSTVISLDGGAGNGVNASGDYVAYCFAEKKSYSKFNSYVGNGSTDGVFCYTGMKPSFVMVKGTDINSQWTMIDNKRDSFNVCDAKIFANTADAEGQEVLVDFVSSGFKIRSATSNWNASGNNYIYMAFAENPLVGTNGVPTTAR